MVASSQNTWATAFFPILVTPKLMSTMPSVRFAEADVYRLRGDILNVTGDRAAAEQSYHQALAVAERQSAKLFELRAATSLARLWRDQGKRRSVK
jgi:hypothetical protein